MIGDPQIPDQSAVDRIVFAIRKAKTQTPSADNATGFCALLSIDVQAFDEDCCYWLSESLLGNIQGGLFTMGYLNSQLEPVVFQSKEAAEDGARSLKQNLDRKFMFGLYRVARKKYQMPPEEEQPVKFFN